MDTQESDSAATHPRSRSRGRGRRLAAPVITLVLLLVGAGTAAAFTVSVKTITPEKPVREMLPASTAFVIIGDLNPTGSSRKSLDALGRTFTSQAGWQNALHDLQGRAQSSACVDRLTGQAKQNLSDIGHEAAFAIIDPAGVSGTGLDTQALAGRSSLAFQRSAVALIPLHKNITLAMALSATTFSLPQKAEVFRGTTIYRETLSSCSAVSKDLPRAFYASLFKGYIVLGLLPRPIERVIATADGATPNLAGNSVYRSLMAQLSGDRLASYYLNSRSLLHGLDIFSGTHGLTSSYATGAQPAAGALTITSSGLRLVTASVTTSRPNPQPAGAIEMMLPANTLMLVSAQGLSTMVHHTISQLDRSKLLSRGTHATIDPMVNDLTGDMIGETDLVMLAPTAPMSIDISNTRGAPLSVAWQIGDDTLAGRHLGDLLHRLHVARQFHDRSAADGTPYSATSAGYGYSVRNGWAIASLSIVQTLKTFVHPPVHSLATLPALMSATSAGSRPTSLWYVNLRDLRHALEAAVTSGLPASAITQYNRDALPLLAPLYTISGSAGSNRAGSIAVSTILIGIGPGTDTSATR